jgi:hypothetical protein
VEVSECCVAAEDLVVIGQVAQPLIRMAAGGDHDVRGIGLLVAAAGERDVREVAAETRVDLAV